MPLESIDVHAEVSPASRHRGFTIEGAVSLENVLDLIEWAPKAGFNSYFIQFRTAFEFFDRWYSHAGNDLIPREPFSEEDAARFVRLIAEKVKERDMIFHAVGHGWTAACVGISADGWKGMDDDLTDRQRGMLAEIGGKEGLFQRNPAEYQSLLFRSRRAGAHGGRSGVLCRGASGGRRAASLAGGRLQ